MKKKTAALVVFLSIVSGSVFSQEIWEKLDGPYSAPVGELFAMPNGNIVALTNYGHVYISSDGEQWRYTGIMSRSFTGDKKGRWFDFERDRWSSDEGATWQNMATKAYGLAPVHAYDVGLNGFFYASDDDVFFWGGYMPAPDWKGLFCSTDLGVTWGHLTDPAPLWFGSPSFIVTKSGSYCISTMPHPDSIAIYRSVDKGATWKLAHAVSRMYDYPTVVFTEDAFGVLYATCFQGYSQSLFRSTDDGQTWEKWGPRRWDIREIAHLPNGRIIVRSEIGLYRISQNLSKWEPAQGSLHDYPMKSLLAINDSTLYVATSHGIWKTTDTCHTWRRVNKGLIDERQHSNGKPLALDSTGAIYTGDGPLWRSTDNGKTWEERSVFPAKYGAAKVAASPQIDYLTVSDNNILYAGLDWSYLSNDWDFDHTTLYWAKPDSMRIARSSDGGRTWEYLCPLPNRNRIQSLLVTKKGSIFVVFEYQSDSLIVSRDGGKSWTPFPVVQYRRPESLQQDCEGRLYLTLAGGGGLFVSLDDGYTWSFANTHVLVDNVGPHDELISFASQDSFLLSFDHGKTWDTSSVSFCPWLEQAAINPAGHVFTPCAVFSPFVQRTTDWGKNWTDFSSGITPYVDSLKFFGGVNRIVSDRNGYLYASSYSYVYRTRKPTLPCETALQVSLGAPSFVKVGDAIDVPIAVASAVGLQGNASIPFVLRYDNSLIDLVGVRNEGDDIDSLFTEFISGGVRITVYGPRPVSGQAFVTLRFRFHEQPFEPTFVSFSFTGDSLANCPTVFNTNTFTMLVDGQCDKIVRRKPGLPPPVVYPNPIRSSGETAFTLKQGGQIRMALYDAFGREVRTIAQGEYATGTHRITLDASGLPSGSYYLRLTAPEGTAGKRIVVSK